MSLIEQIITISIASITTMLTRFLPFVIFSNKKHTSGFIQLLGTFLPPAILGMLVVYCFKDALMAFNANTVISLVAGLVTVLIHLWKRNMLLSIFGGTACYMLLLQLI